MLFPVPAVLPFLCLGKGVWGCSAGFGEESLELALQDLGKRIWGWLCRMWREVWGWLCSVWGREFEVFSAGFGEGVWDRFCSVWKENLGLALQHLEKEFEIDSAASGRGFGVGPQDVGTL